MNKFTVLITFLLSIGISTIHAVPEFIAQAYCKILGNKDASKEHKQRVYEALKALGVENPEKIPVKQMNGIGPTFARIDLSSFTAFGIWLDEKYLNSCTENEAIFHMYHEASHYVLRHHQQILAGSTLGIPTTIAGFIGLHKLLSLGNFSLITKLASLSGVTAATLLVSYLFILPKVSKSQEKQADTMAAKLLIRLGKSSVVEEHINNLKKCASDEENIWWHSPTEQIKYLAMAESKTE